MLRGGGGRKIFTVLLADTPAGLRELAPVIDGAARVLTAETYEQAMQRCMDDRPDAVLVGYHFDEVRPYRLIQELKEQACAKGIPVILVRALALASSGDESDEIRAGYRELGADDFIDFFAERKSLGKKLAGEWLRERLLGRASGRRG